MEKELITRIISVMCDVFDRTDMTEEEEKLCDMGIGFLAMIAGKIDK